MKQIIFVPGWGSSYEILMGVIPGYESADIKFVCWKDVSSPEEYVLKVKSIFRETNLNETLVVGWSLGAIASLEAATQKAPLAMVLFGGAARFTVQKETGQRWGWPSKVLETMKEQLYQEPADVMSAFCSNMFSKSEKAKGEEHLFAPTILDKLQEYSTESLVAGLEYLEKTDIRDCVDYINSYVLLIHGSEDRICPVNGGQRLADNIGSKARCVVIGGAGHVPFLTQRPTCKSIIRSFLSERGLL